MCHSKLRRSRSIIVIDIGIRWSRRELVGKGSYDKVFNKIPRIPNSPLLVVKSADYEISKRGASDSGPFQTQSRNHRLTRSETEASFVH
ncbi:unnamed protein product [Linum trigynum]|uniref:Uncharacterized protein n=1 Tax=Linum trigynum TaxID=586398 RepID=A0AAV2FPH6_9ROSI